MEIGGRGPGPTSAGWVGGRAAARRGRRKPSLPSQGHRPQKGQECASNARAREGGREGGRQAGGRAGGREAGRQGGREGGREREREGGGERPRPDRRPPTRGAADRRCRVDRVRYGPGGGARGNDGIMGSANPASRRGGAGGGVRIRWRGFCSGAKDAVTQIWARVFWKIAELGRGFYRVLDGLGAGRGSDARRRVRHRVLQRFARFERGS